MGVYFSRQLPGKGLSACATVIFECQQHNFNQKVYFLLNFQDILTYPWNGPCYCCAGMDDRGNPGGNTLFLIVTANKGIRYTVK